MKIKKNHHHPLLSLIFIAVNLIIISLIVLQRDQIRNWLSKANGIEANLVVYTQNVLGKTHRPWNNLSQGGESSNWRLLPILDKVALLSPEYIRIDHVYDFYVIVTKNPRGDLEFDWSRLDQLLDDIETLGAKPFISLSYMPPALTTGDIVDKPLDWRQWQLVVQKTIEHISGIEGRNLGGVYYEVWNEPDLFGQWYYQGEKNYLDLYRYAAVGAKTAVGVQPFKLGGPAVTAFYPNWFKALFDLVIREQLPLDFISWHRYHPSVDGFAQESQSLDKLLESYPQIDNSIEQIISEWGFDSNNHHGYDTTLAAAHLVAVASNLPPTLNKVILFEIEDGVSPSQDTYWGRWGLITNHTLGAKIKPRYQALYLLQQQGDHRLELHGQGSWVTGLASKTLIPNQKIIIIMANYDYQERHQEVTPVTFKDLEPGKYKVLQKYLDGNIQTYHLSTETNELRHQVYLPPNTVVKVEVQKE